MHITPQLDTLRHHCSNAINLGCFLLCSNLLIILHSVAILSLILHLLLFLGIMKRQRLELPVWIKSDWLLLQLEEVKVPLPAEEQEQQQQLPERN